MSARKTERLLNLVICLLATRRYLSVHKIRDAVPGYPEDGPGGDDSAFRRMFERDKEDLRELGIPLETGTDSVWDDEPGYRIARRDYELPEISLTADEAAAVGLAGRLWRSARLADAASGALMKLRAAGLEPDGGPAGLEPRVSATEPAFEPLLEAVRGRRSVSFAYRAAGAAEPTRRRLDPWGVVSWRGRWYVVGHDLERAAARVFRLSRITGSVRSGAPDTVRTPCPSDLDLRAVVSRYAEEQPNRPARLLLRRDAGAELRRLASRVRRREDGWDEVTVGFGDPGRLADRVAVLGPDAVVLEPADARAAVLARLTAAADAPVAARGTGGAGAADVGQAGQPTSVAAW